MELKLDTPKVLSDVIAIISELVTEVKIRVEKEGLIIGAIDPANVAFIHFKLPAESFSKFEIGEKEVLGVNLDSFKSVLRRCSPKSTLILKSEDNILKIQIQDRIMRNFSIALIDIDAEDKAMPNLEFTSKVEINSKDFVDAIEDCSIVADSCAFVSGKDNFSIQAQGLNSAKVEFSSDEAIINSQDESRSKYSLEYLQKFIKACKLSEKTVTSFSNEYPLRLDFKSPNNAELSFVLAPRMENED